VIHLGDFYIKAKFLGEVNDVIINGKHYHDLGTLVIEKFQFPLYAFGYMIMMIFLGFHLHHGFESAFQSLGLNHSRYTPFIQKLSTVVAIILTLGFIAIPLVIYFGNY
jgi:succinate dehydrogenase / fumarate reductase cytochrome b subunit